jgi:hypothetical protein
MTLLLLRTYLIPSMKALAVWTVTRIKILFLIKRKLVSMLPVTAALFAMNHPEKITSFMGL